MGVRQKLVLLSLLILIVVSFGFALVQLQLSRTWAEEDLKERAVIFAREVAATIGDHHELRAGAGLERKIQQIMAVRQSVLQLEILGFDTEETGIIATSDPLHRLPFTREDADRVHKGRVVSRLVTDGDGRYWEVMAPISLEGAVAGGIAAKFSLKRFDQRDARARLLALELTAISVLIMGSLMSLAVYWVVNRPVGRFMRAIADVEGGVPAATVGVHTTDEFGALARHFNAMIARSEGFNQELKVRIAEATEELEGRYREVERLHELLFATQRKLSHAERLAIPGRIMAEVAHEVGTPLHSVMGHLELLREDLPPTALAGDTVRRLEVISSQLRRMAEIITKLLDVTRPTPGQPEPVDLNRLVRETSELVRPAVAAAGLSLQVATEPELPPIQGHGGQLQQVVLNLLTNAMDATPSGGSIHVQTRRRADEDAVELEIRDTGRGIGQEEQRRIFEPFFSTKGSGRGTGLGLFISAQIVRDHKGRIDLESAEGRGSTLRVVLPASLVVA